MNWIKSYLRMKCIIYVKFLFSFTNDPLRLYFFKTTFLGLYYFSKIKVWLDKMGYSCLLLKTDLLVFPNLSHSLTFFLFLFLVFFSCSLVSSEENSCTAQWETEQFKFLSKLKKLEIKAENTLVKHQIYI